MLLELHVVVPTIELVVAADAVVPMIELIVAADVVVPMIELIVAHHNSQHLRLHPQ